MHISQNLEVPFCHEEALSMLRFGEITKEERQRCFNEAARKAKESLASKEVIDMLIDFEIRHFGHPVTSIAILSTKASKELQERMLNAALSAGEVLDVLRMEEVLRREITEEEATQLAEVIAVFTPPIPYKEKSAKALYLIARRYPENSPLRQRLLVNILPSPKLQLVMV